MLAIVTYQCMNALRTVRLPPRANVPAQRMRRTNAFAATRGDNTAMRPFSKLLWILVIYHRYTNHTRIHDDVSEVIAPFAIKR